MLPRRLHPAVRPGLRPGLRLALPAGLAGGLLAAGDQGPVLCPFRLCTGGYCPGCGLTRAAGRLARGDLAGSWHQHPFLLVAVVEAVALGAAWGLWRRWRLGAGHPAEGLGPAAFLGRGQVPLILANWLVLVAIWLVRLRIGAIPAPFS